MHRAGWLAIVLLMPLTAGCLGSVTPAEIPASTLNQKNWVEHSSSSEALVAGIGEKVTTEYRKSGGSQLSAVLVVSANDIPILDERRFIPQAIERIEQQRNIQLDKSGTTDLQLSNLGGTQITADEYRFQKGSAKGKAVVFTPSCGPFVVVAAYGVTDPAGLTTSTTYGEARDVARAVSC